MMNCQTRCREQFRWTNCLLSHRTPNNFVTSQWTDTCSCTAVFYLVFRLVVVLFFLVFIILTGAVEYDWYHVESDRIKWFIYLTNWSFFMLTVDVLVQAATTVSAFYKNRRAPNYEGAQGMSWYLKTQWVITNIATTAGFTASLGYWLSIVTPGEKIHWVDFNTHTTNSIYLVLNLFITATPVRLYHIWHPLLFQLVYVSFTAVYYFAGGTSASDTHPATIYENFDWSNPGGALFSGFLLLVEVAAVWLVVWGIYWLRLLQFHVIGNHPCSNHSRNPDETSYIEVAQKGEGNKTETVYGTGDIMA